MPYSYSRLFEEVTGRKFENRPVFDPPKLTPLRKPVDESTIGLFAICGARLPETGRIAGGTRVRVCHSLQLLTGTSSQPQTIARSR